MASKVSLEDNIEIRDPTVFELLVLGGVIGGIAGGLAFAILVAVYSTGTDFFSVVGNLFLETNSVVIGFIIHIGIAILFGILFGIILIVFPKLGSTQVITILSGLVWGLFLWIVAGNILMSLILGTPLDQEFALLFKIDTWTSANNIRSRGG